LNQPDPVQEFFSFAPHEPVTSCLQQLQNDLLMAFEPESSPQATLVKDESLQIHSCHTAMREAEIVAECLKKAMHQHPEWHWHDMAIMAPDIELYASALQAALGDLPHTIADRPWPTHEAMADAWLAILSLLDGRFEWDRVLSLLERPLVQEWLNLTPQEIKDLEHWVEVAAIRWGLNHEHVREQGLPDCGPITWEDGLDRLLMGWMMRTSTHIGHCFPVNGIEGEALKPLASLLALLSCLEEGAALAAQPPKGQEWVEWIQSWLDRWQDQKTLPNGTMRAVLATLQRTWEDLELDEPMPLAVFRNAFQQAIGSQSGMRGFLHGSITCCSLLPMRAIPFRFLAVMGMNEGAFPAKDHGLAFDLMATEKGRRPADRSRRQDQRHQFIELILTAEDRLIFTFQGRSQQKNEPQPPALLLEQLHQAFFQQHGVDLLQEHPLKRYHPRNFSSSGWLSSDASAFHLAQLMAKSLVAIAKPLPGNWWMRPGIPQEKPIKTISLTEFLAFFRNPQKQFLKTTLGWQEQPLPQKPVAEELVDLDSLQAYHLKSRILETLLAGTALDHLYMRLLAEGQCPPGQPGQLLFVEECARIEPFAKFVCQAISGSQKEKKQISLHLGGYHLIGELLTYSGRLVFARPTTLKPKDRFNAFLLHLVSRSWTDQDTLVLAMDDSCPKGFRIVRLLGHSPDELLPFLVHFDQGLTHPLDLPIDLGDKLDTLWRHQPLDSENFHKFQEAFIKNLKSGPFLAPPPEERTLLFPNPEKVQFSSEVYKQYQDLMAPVWESFE
jgi:exodeoxyribonuclease V gamma subunit